MEIPVGATCTVRTQVDQSNLASVVGSGMVEVFATPMMIALMEKAAAQCVAEYLQPGQTTVGTQINVGHSAATPVGMTVAATATVTAIDRRRIDFTVSAQDDAGEIGQGVHTRFVVDKQSFQQKAAQRGQ